MTFKKKGLIFIMALYEEMNTADMLGRLEKNCFAQLCLKRRAFDTT